MEFSAKSARCIDRVSKSARCSLYYLDYDTMSLVWSYLSTMCKIHLWRSCVSKLFTRLVSNGVFLTTSIIVNPYCKCIPTLVHLRASNLRKLYWDCCYNVLSADRVAVVKKFFLSNQYICEASVPSDICAYISFSRMKLLSIRVYNESIVNIYEAVNLESLSIVCCRFYKIVEVEAVIARSLPRFHHLRSLHLGELWKNVQTVSVVLPCVTKFSCGYRLENINALFCVFPNLIYLGCSCQISNSALDGDTISSLQYLSLADILYTNSNIFRKFPSLKFVTYHVPQFFGKKKTLIIMEKKIQHLFAMKLVSTSEVCVTSEMWTPVWRYF